MATTDGMDLPLLEEKAPRTIREAFLALGVRADGQLSSRGRLKFSDEMVKSWRKDVDEIYYRLEETYCDGSLIRERTYIDLANLLQKHGPQIWGGDSTSISSFPNRLSPGESEFYLNELRYPRDKERIIAKHQDLFTIRLKSPSSSAKRASNGDWGLLQPSLTPRLVETAQPSAQTQRPKSTRRSGNPPEQKPISEVVAAWSQRQIKYLFNKASWAPQSTARENNSPSIPTLFENTEAAHPQKQPGHYRCIDCKTNFTEREKEMHTLLCPFGSRHLEYPEVVQRDQGDGGTDRQSDNGNTETVSANRPPAMLIVRCDDVVGQSAVQLNLDDCKEVELFFTLLSKYLLTPVKEVVVTLPCDLNRFIPTGGSYLNIVEDDQSAYLSFLMVAKSTDMPIFYCSVYSTSEF